MSKKAGVRAKYALLEHSTKRTCDIAATVSVGRENTDLVFPSLVSLSRQHFRIVVDEDGAWIEDLGSSNGTKLNQAKLEPNIREPLYNGDSIIAGKVVFTFQIRPTIKKQETNPGIEVEHPRDLGVPKEPPKLEERLSPEISIDLHSPGRHPGAGRPHEAPISMLAYSPEESKTKKRRRSYGAIVHQWTTLGLAGVLYYIGQSEVETIQRIPSGGPHSVKDLLLRYFFAVGLMYLSMVAMQFLFVLTFARRWYAAILAVGISVFLGTLIGDRLDQFAEYRKAEVENSLQAYKNVKKKIVRSDRMPASDGR